MRELEDLKSIHAAMVAESKDNPEIIPITSSITALISQCRLPEGHLDEPLLEDLLLNASVCAEDPKYINDHIKVEFGRKEEILEKYEICQDIINTEKEAKRQDEAIALIEKQKELEELKNLDEKVEDEAKSIENGL